MKNVSLIFLSNIFLFSAMYAENIPLLNKEQIAVKAQDIKRRLTYDRYMKNGFIALSLANEFYKWGPFLKDCFGIHTVSQKPVEQMGFLASIKSGFEYLFYTKEGWAAILQSTATAGSALVISKVSNLFIHPDTFRWYIQAHAPYYITIKLLNEQCAAMHNEQLDMHDRVIAQELIPTLFKRLVSQAELMCAYMMYKTNNLPAEEKLIAQRSAGLMFATHNKRLIIIADMLKSDAPDYHEIESQLDSYFSLVKSQVNHFSIIEGEDWNERNMVKNTSKVA